MREIRTSGSTRGQWGAGYNRYPLSYSTGHIFSPRNHSQAPNKPIPIHKISEQTEPNIGKLRTPRSRPQPRGFASPESPASKPPP